MQSNLNKFFLFLSFLFLCNISTLYAESIISMDVDNNFIIVKDYKKIEKYKKIFEYFFNKYKINKNTETFDKNFIIDCLVLKNTQNILEFDMYLVGHAKENVYEYYNIGRYDKDYFCIQKYHSVDPDSLKCFLGIIFEEGCLGRPNFDGARYLKIDVLKKFLDNWDNENL